MAAMHPGVNQLSPFLEHFELIDLVLQEEQKYFDFLIRRRANIILAFQHPMIFLCNIFHKTTCGWLPNPLDIRELFERPHVPFPSPLQLEFRH
jgi:hypothetical protein